MIDPGGLKSASALVEYAVRPMMMDVVRGKHRDSAMAMLGVVPAEERSTEGDGGGDVLESAREARVVLQGFEVGLGERVVVGHLGAAQRAGHAEIGQ